MKTIQQVERLWRDKGATGMMWDYPDSLPRLAKDLGAPVTTIQNMIITGKIPVRHVHDSKGKCSSVIMSEDVVRVLKSKPALMLLKDSRGKK